MTVRSLDTRDSGDVRAVSGVGRAEGVAGGWRWVALDMFALGRYRRSMAQSILVFDFGSNEEAAQQARHKVAAWAQSFRLGKKILLKFDREDPSATPEGEDGELATEGSEETKSSKTESRAPRRETDSKTKMNENSAASSRVRLLIRLDFSDHEKLSHQRWLGRIPAEEPFKSVKAETIRTGDAAFAKTAKLFDSLG